MAADKDIEVKEAPSATDDKLHADGRSRYYGPKEGSEQYISSKKPKIHKVYSKHKHSKKRKKDDSSSEDESSSDNGRSKSKKKGKGSSGKYHIQKIPKTKAVEERRRKREERKEKKRRESRRKHYGNDDDERKESREEKREKQRIQRMFDQADKEKEKALKRKAEVAEVMANVDNISEDDYFSKNKEFSTWLKEERRIFFSDLSSEESRKYFEKFVQLWNKKKLAPKFYKGISQEIVQRSSHNWSFQKNQNHELGNAEAEEEEKKSERRRERKKMRKDEKELLEEMLPRATGREAVIEKKVARREEIKSREFSPEPMRESDIMGGGDDFRSRLIKERERKERREREREDAFRERQTSYLHKEEEKMEQFRALVSMAGGKITIPKRENA